MKILCSHWSKFPECKSFIVIRTWNTVLNFKDVYKNLQNWITNMITSAHLLMWVNFITMRRQNFAEIEISSLCARARNLWSPHLLVYAQPFHLSKYTVERQEILSIDQVWFEQRQRSVETRRNLDMKQYRGPCGQLYFCQPMKAPAGTLVLFLTSLGNDPSSSLCI